MNVVDSAPVILFFKAHVGPYLRRGKLVNLAGYQGKQARAVAGAGQMDMFGDHPTDSAHASGGNWQMPIKEAIKEHKELIHAAETPSKADDKREVEKQREELRRMEGATAYNDAVTSTKTGPDDEHKPGVLNERLGIKSKSTPYTPVTDDSHPAPLPRSLMSSIPEDRLAEWKDLHRQQHELHHYELGQVREKMDRVRSKRHKAESAMREAEASANSLRGAPVRDPAREAYVQKIVDSHHAEFAKLVREEDALVGKHQTLHEKAAKLGRAKDKILAGSGKMDMDYAAMRNRTAQEQKDHEKSMLKMYREHRKTTGTKAPDYGAMIKIAADSIQKLRASDVDRVLEQNDTKHRAGLADYIKKNRKDLAEEVDDVMADLGQPLTKSIVFIKRKQLPSS